MQLPVGLASREPRQAQPHRSRPAALFKTAQPPGVDKEDVDLRVIEDSITLRAEKKSTRQEKDDDYQLAARRFGTFQRAMRLPAQGQPDGVSANFKDGVLKLTLVQGGGRRTGFVQGGNRITGSEPATTLAWRASRWATAAGLRAARRSGCLRLPSPFFRLPKIGRIRRCRHDPPHEALRQPLGEQRGKQVMARPPVPFSRRRHLDMCAGLAGVETAAIAGCRGVSAGTGAADRDTDARRCRAGAAASARR